MSPSDKIDLSRDFAAGVYLSEAQNQYTTPLTHCIPVYSILIHTERGRGVESWTREMGKGATWESTDHKASLKTPTWLNVRKKLAISSLWNTCRKATLKVNFFRWHFALTSMSLIFLRGQHSSLRPHFIKKTILHRKKFTEIYVIE